MADEESDATVVALSEEQLLVRKRQVETDRVRVRTLVDERDVMVEETLNRGVVSVERVAVDREVPSAPPPREEGDVLVISMVEERAVVEKRLFVVEELRVRRTTVAEHVSLPTTLRSMRAVVERDGDRPHGEDARE